MRVCSNVDDFNNRNLILTAELLNQGLRYIKFDLSKGAKIRNEYNQVTNSQLDTTNESQEVSLFPAGDHKAQINRRTQT